MSGNEDDKGDINKVYPLDLVSKLNVKPVTELPKGTPLLMSGQPLPLRRVLTQAVAVSGSGNTSTAINIVPQTIIKQGILSQNQSLATVKPTQITLATSVVQSGATYHVPRGPAAVANLATPRSAVASPIRAPGGAIVASQQPISGGGFVSTVRQVTPSPATTWLTSNMQIQNQQIVKNASTTATTTTTTTPAAQLQRISTVVGRTQIITRTTQSTSVNVGQLRQPPQQQQQQQIFKTTMAQVLPTRPQTLVYSAPHHHHFMARKPVTTTSATATTSTTPVRPLNQMIGTRVAVPVPVTTARLTVAPGPTTIYTTGARLSTHSIVGAGTGARVNVQQSVNRSGIPAAAGTLLTTTQARIATVAAAAPQQQQQQQQSAVVIGTQAGGRLAASVVSLHPVVVGNPSSSSGSSTRQQQQSSKMTNQGAIQLAQVPAVAKLPVVPVPSTMPRTINTTIVGQRPIISVPQSQTISIPITKVFPPQGTTTATPIIRRATTSPVASNSKEEVTTYYYHDTVTGNNNTNTSSSQYQFSPVMVVEQKQQQQQQQPPPTMEHILNPLPSIGKVTSSPRPSILRKRDRDGDGSTLKAAKNLAPLLSNIGGGVVAQGPSSPPSRPLSRDNNDNSSGGSTTISATSSPGLGEIGGDDSQPLPSVVVQAPAAAQVALKLVEEVKRQQQQQQQEEENRRRHHAQEMSPRKKPRKQQLIGNDEPKFNIDDMQFLSENKMKKDEHHVQQLSTMPATITATPTKPSINQNNEVTVKKPQSASLLNSYRQTWKSTHNHYLRYTDVKPKDERRPTIIDLANQTQVMQKINGWKIHHLSTQMEDLSDLETQVYDKLSTMLKLIETKESRGYDKEFNRINELIKGNMQRSKIINDSTSEAKSQVMKIFDHKEHVADIIQRCASKRNFKKREK